MSVGTHLKHAESLGLSKLTGSTPPFLMIYVKKQTPRKILVHIFHDLKVSGKTQDRW